MVDQGRCTAPCGVSPFCSLHRSTLRYQAKQPNAWLAKLKTALRRLSNAFIPMLGLPEDHTAYCKKDGWKCWLPSGTAVCVANWA